MSSTLPFNPADPDAPLIALMTIQSNPELLTMSDTELSALLDHLKSYTQQPASLTSKLQRESDEKKPRGANSVARAERARKLAEL